ncbi:DUF1328 family protein [Yoonia litorea]|uniref:Uncharacterized protein n=1 Tax=Yoonia litorea TaxID=1123755 RepID=A0A1I6N0K3_9RHOB|nr:DUF1328 family protein [Yoonia litorea]SFS21318.1 Protein of unknown function [Yoonia litorea]
MAYTLVFLSLSLIAGIFGFGGFVGTSASADIAQILCFVFLSIALLTLIVTLQSKR